jgi:adenosine deaminase
MTTPQGEGGTARRYWPEIVLVLLFAAVVVLVSSGPGSDTVAPTSGERRAIQAFADAEALGEPRLYALLRDMPKGADLHMHLSGAVYAETFLKDAAEDGLCVDPKALALVASTAAGKAGPKAGSGKAGPGKAGPPGKAGQGAPAPQCPKDDQTAASVFANQRLNDELVDAFSMRSYFPTPGLSGHDQFFATFDRFSGIDKSHQGEWLDEVAQRAAAQNEQYLEVMMTPSFFDLAPLWTSLGWPATPAGTPVDPLGDATGTSRAELSALRAKLLDGGLRKEATLNEQELDGALAARGQLEHCGQPNAAAACAVKIRLLYQVLRAFPPQQVFAQTLLAFEVASADPNVVGLNFVQPEDAYLAMSEYNRQMHMLDYLHSVYPQVHISLHAGELAVGLVPPAGLNFHIREAIDLGHAERIGHGVDVEEEKDGQYLPRMMAKRHVMVEINLTSNDVILGVKGDEHPLEAYLAAGTPVALSTDDEGVSRIDLTHEFVRAAMEHHVGYLDLKAMARTSIEHSFLPGESLWVRRDVFTRVKPACVVHWWGPRMGVKPPTQACQAFLNSSPKAAEEWELERRFAVFERNVH